MAWGQALNGLSDDIWRFLEGRKQEKFRREDMARDDARYKTEQDYRTRMEAGANDDRMFNRAQATRERLGPGETQNPQVGELLSKYGFAKELDQSQENETEGTVNQTNPRRFSLPANFLERTQQADQDWQTKARGRQETEWGVEDKQRGDLDAFMQGLTPEQQTRAKAQRFVPGFDPNEPTWEVKQATEHKNRLSEIAAGRQNEMDPEMKGVLEVLRITKPDENADPDAFVRWQQRASELLGPYLAGGDDPRPPLGPQAPAGPDSGGLGDLPALSTKAPLNYNAPPGSDESTMDMIKRFLEGFKTRTDRRPASEVGENSGYSPR